MTDISAQTSLDVARAALRASAVAAFMTKLPEVDSEWLAERCQELFDRLRQNGGGGFSVDADMTMEEMVEDIREQMYTHTTVLVELAFFCVGRIALQAIDVTKRSAEREQ